MATVTIGKWDNAPAIRIPQPFCEQLGIEVGDPVRMFVDGRKRIIIEVPAEQNTLQARMVNWDGTRYKTQEYDWGDETDGETKTS